MARRTLSASVSLGSVPRWIALVGIVVASRIVSSGWMLWFAERQAANAWTDARPNLFEFSRIWDSHWYRIIAEVGYPGTLPLTADGNVGENAWAFMPIYPFLVRVVMGLTGLPFAVVSVFLSVTFFTVFVFLADRLFRHVLGSREALWAVAIVAFSPVSPIFQVGYSESLGMVFLTLALIGLLEKRWWLTGIAIPLAALTRPLGVPLAIMMGILMLMAWRSGRDRAPHVWLTLIAGASAIAWPIIAWVYTGVASAYLDTEMAWRRPYVGDDTHAWGTGWWQSANWWFPDIAIWVLAVVAVGVIAFAVIPSTRRLGSVLTVWSWGYLGYLVLVLFPQSSLFRLLAPMFPLAGSFARNRTASILAVIAGIAGQVVWLDWCWSVQGSDWTPP